MNYPVRRQVLATAFSLLLFIFLNNPSQAQETPPSPSLWQRTEGLPIPYLVTDVESHADHLYAGINAPDKNAPLPAEEMAGVYRLGPDGLTWERIAPPTNWYKKVGNLFFDPQGRIYTYHNYQQHLWRFDPAQPDAGWQRLFDRHPAEWTIVSDNRYAQEQGWVIGRDGLLYATAQHKERGDYQIIRFNEDDGSWTPVSPPFPTYREGDENGPVHPVWNPRAQQLADGTWVASNTHVTSVSQCGGAPKTQPDNQLMWLQAGVWQSLSRADLGIQGAGYTCGWGMVRLFVGEDGTRMWATGGSGQYYVWAAERGRWLLEEEYGYGGSPNYVTLGSQGLIGGRGWMQQLTDAYTYRSTSDISAQGCRAVNHRHLRGVKGGALAVTQLTTRLFDECGSDYEIADREGRNIEEMRAAFADKPDTTVNRGLYVIQRDPAQVRRRDLAVETASYLLSTAGSHESGAGVGLQADGGAVIAGNFNGASLDGLTVHRPLGAETTGPGWVVRLSPEGTAIRAVSVLGERVDHLAVLADDRIAVVGSFGVALLNAAGDTVLWQQPLSGSTNQRLDAAPDGRVVTLSGKSVSVWSDQGALLTERTLTHDYVTDVALDAGRDRLYVGGFDNRRNGNPVQIAFVLALDVTAELSRVWKSWGYDPASLDNDMADTRIYRLTLHPDGSRLYAGGESAGGNTIFRWNGHDLSTNTWVSSGAGSSADMWMAKSAAHLSYIAEIDVADGRVVRGQMNAAVLRSQQRLNTTRFQCDIAVDEAGNLYYCGASAAFIPGRVGWQINGERIDNGDLAGYAGGDPYLLILTPRMNDRHAWLTFSRWQNAGEATALAIRGDRGILINTVHKGQAITTANALQPTAADLTSGETRFTDLYFVLWQKANFLDYQAAPPAEGDFGQRIFLPMVMGSNQ